MQASDQMDLIAAALAAAQGEMPAAPLDGKNPHFGSRYATLTALVSTARPVLAKHGLSIIQGRGDAGCIDTLILHTSGQWIVAEGVPMKPTKDDPQGVASAITYARRYGLAAAVGLVADDDDDGNAASKPHSSEPKPEPRPESTPDASAHKDAGERVDKGAAVLEGHIVQDPYTTTIQVKGQPCEVARFDLAATDGNTYSVTAWHGARDEAMAFKAGAEVEVTGTWNHYRDRWNVNAASVRDVIPW